MTDESRRQGTTAPPPPPHAAMAQLQENAAAFFSDFLRRHAEKMNCRLGCAACCHATFSVFRAEASRILDWACRLPHDVARNLSINLQKRAASDAKGTTTSGMTPTGLSAPPCPFLIEGACSIYPARPIVCRTQGVPLLWQGDSGGPAPSAEETSSIRLDVCPLHPGRDHPDWPPVDECLDVDRLNTLVSMAQRDFESKTRSPARHDQDVPQGYLLPDTERVSLEAVRSALVALWAAAEPS